MSKDWSEDRGRQAFVACAVRVLLLAQLVAGWPPQAFADPEPTLVAPQAVLVDSSYGHEVLMSKGLDSKALQGRIAKLMTAYEAGRKCVQGR